MTCLIAHPTRPFSLFLQQYSAISNRAEFDFIHRWRAGATQKAILPEKHGQKSGRAIMVQSPSKSASNAWQSSCGASDDDRLIYYLIENRHNFLRLVSEPHIAAPQVCYWSQNQVFLPTFAPPPPNFCATFLPESSDLLLTFVIDWLLLW